MYIFIISFDVGQRVLVLGRSSKSSGFFHFIRGLFLLCWFIFLYNFYSRLFFNIRRWQIQTVYHGVSRKQGCGASAYLATCSFLSNRWRILKFVLRIFPVRSTTQAIACIYFALTFVWRTVELINLSWLWLYGDVFYRIHGSLWPQETCETHWNADFDYLYLDL